MEQISKKTTLSGKSLELPQRTDQNQSLGNNLGDNLFREMYKLRPYRTVDLEQTNSHPQETLSHQGEETQIQLETHENDIKTLPDKIILSRLKAMQTPIDPTKENSPSLIDQAYREAKSLMTDMIEYPTKNTEKYHNMSEEEYRRFIKYKTDITYYQQELNNLNQYSGVYFHSNQYVQTDAFKRQTIQLYKDISQKVLKTYKDYPPIQTIWERLHGLETSTHTLQQEHYDQFTQTDTTSDLSQQHTEGLAASTIRRKGWNIDPLQADLDHIDIKFKITRKDSASKLTYEMIENFCKEKFEARVYNTVNNGLQKLINNTEIPEGHRTLFRKTKDALHNLQNKDNILYLYQLKEKINCWYLQDSQTKNIYIGNRGKNNGHNIENEVINSLRLTRSDSKRRACSYSKNLESNFTLGLEEGIIKNDANNILISIDYNFSGVHTPDQQFTFIITEENNVYITDKYSKLSLNLYGDKNYMIHRKNSSTSGWHFYQLNPYTLEIKTS